MKRRIIIILILTLTNFAFGQNNISKKVSESFHNENKQRLDSIAKKLNYKGGDQIKVFTIFSVNENGNIVDVKARSVHPLFEKEAIRIIKELPKMTPAEYDGKKISKKYSLPIVFEIETERAKKRRLKKEKREKEKKLKKGKN